MTRRDSDPAEVHRRFAAAIAAMELDELGQIAGQLLSVAGRVPGKPKPRPSLRKPRRSEAAMLRVRVDLEHARPPIWRRLDVRSDIGLDVFHQVLQAAFGWTDSHLHRFALGGSPFDRDAELFLCPYDAEEGEDDGSPAKDVTLDETLSEPGDILRYCYDYGDSWDLIVLLEAVLPARSSAPVAVCVDGRRAAPPEDCGGLRTEADLAEILEDPTRFDLDDVNTALNDPYLVMCDSGVDPRLVEILNRLRYTSPGDDLVQGVTALIQARSEASPGEESAALRPFLWFLDHVGDDGLPLTSAGYLKPDDVTAAADVIPAMAGWIGTANRESQTYPVLEFREVLQKLGLVRRYRGRLLLTKAGARVRGNPDGLWRHLADRLPLGKAGSVEIPAGLVALAFAATNGADARWFDRIADALDHLGWSQSTGSPVSADSVRWATADTLCVLENINSAPRSRSARHQIGELAAALARDALLPRSGRA